MLLSLINSNKIRYLIYSLFIILPTTFTSHLYTDTSDKKSTESLLHTLSALSMSIYSDMKASENHIYYSTSLLLSLDSFTSFDILSMCNDTNEYIYHNAFISNAFITDEKGAILYGINDAELLDIQYFTHVDSALKGTPSHYSSFSKNTPFIQLTFPIYSPNKKKNDTENIATPSTDSIKPSGALVLTYSFSHLEEELQRLKTHSPNLNAYLINSNGQVISSSYQSTDPSTTRLIDINYIRQLLDYDPSSSFVLFDEEPVNAIYYNLTGQNWTLLITSTTPSGFDASDFISWLFSFLGITTLTAAETLKKKHALNSCVCPPPK